MCSLKTCDTFVMQNKGSVHILCILYNMQGLNTSGTKWVPWRHFVHFNAKCMLSTEFVQNASPSYICWKIKVLKTFGTFLMENECSEQILCKMQALHTFVRKYEPWTHLEHFWCNIQVLYSFCAKRKPYTLLAQMHTLKTFGTFWCKRKP